jgi:hypothetical protein
MRPKTYSNPNLLLWLKTKPKYQIGHIIAPGGASLGLGSESVRIICFV